MPGLTGSLAVAFLSLSGLYEPSAIQQLPDGRFLVVEDEKEAPFSLLSLAADGTVGVQALRPGFFQGFDRFWQLDDLEGLALARSGELYAVTSHSRNGAGETKKARDRLVRFRIEGDRVVAPAVVDTLKPALLAAHPVLAQAAARQAVKEGDGGLNIEALDFGRDPARLLVGFRSPLHEGRALIAGVIDPAALFERGEPPRVAAELIALDLAGDGIRALAHVPALDGHLIASGPVGREARPFRLWFWRGGPDDPAVPVTLAGREGFERVEGICPARIDGRDHVLIVSDDGSRKAGRPARFLLVEVAALRIGG